MTNLGPFWMDGTKTKGPHGVGCLWGQECAAEPARGPLPECHLSVQEEGWWVAIAQGEGMQWGRGQGEATGRFRGRLLQPVA